MYLGKCLCGAVQITVSGDISERPISHNFVSSKANWEDLDAELPRYDAFEPRRN